MKTFSFNEIIESPHDGRVHIVGEGVEWCVDIVGGQLLFAAHSLQHLTAFESVLPALGYEAALSTYWRLVSLGPYKPKTEEKGLEALGWTSRVLEALIQYKTLNRQQAEKTLAMLSEEAIASLIGLEKATVTWHPFPVGIWHLSVNGVDVFPLVERLAVRIKGWQCVGDRIISPHQRPYCEAPESIYEDIPNGKLSNQTLKALIRLIQGASIRQLAQVLKQDEIRLAQLLYPYIEHRVIKLWPPVAPFDRLPWLPAESIAPDSLNLTSSWAAPAPTTPSSEHKPAHHKHTHHRHTHPSANADHQPPPNRDYLIVCIDDNQLVLNKIHSYLDSDRFKLKSVLDPMGSISKICAMKPDLILLDISMPKIDGHNLCRILKRSLMFKKIPIIMISSNTSALNKAKAQSVGATDYLEKPFSKAQLLRVLETHLSPTE
ncbi:MAG: response regulator [Phormidesmis sp.]